METKVMKVYYNEQGLPFKDSALTIPYSIIGSEFTGANNTTEIRFYVENIDNELTWVANIKLQDGTLTYRLLTPVIDEDDKTYQLLEMDNGITSKKGFIYLGLNGYGGETLIEEVEGVLTINGNPTIVATGTISIALNYTPIVVPLGTSVEPTEIQQILSALSIKQDKFNLNNVRGYDTLALATTDLPNLADGQMVIVKGDNATFYQVQSGSLVELISDKAYKDGDGLVIKSTYGVSVVLSYDSATDTIISKLYASDGTLLDTHSVALSKATTTENGLMAKEDKVKLDGLATTYETIVNSDAKVVITNGGQDIPFAINNAINKVLSKTEYLITGSYIPIYIFKNASPTGYALVFTSLSIRVYTGTQGGTWTLQYTYATQEWANTQLSAKQSTSQKGQADGYASLDSGGKVPSTQLPSYVDDVLEYANLASFPATGSASVIYVALDTNLTYRWSGSAYVEISPSLALGETAETAYRGDRGKIAYDHSQSTSGNPHNVRASEINFDNTIKNLLTATKVQGAIDELADEVLTPTYENVLHEDLISEITATNNVEIIDDAGVLIKVEGNEPTNLISNSEFNESDLSFWESGNSTKSVVNGVAVITGNVESTYTAMHHDYTPLIPLTDLLYVSYKVRTTSANVTYISTGTSGFSVPALKISNPVQNTWYVRSGISSTRTGVQRFLVQTTATNTNGVVTEVDYVNIYNITDMINKGIKNDSGVLFSELSDAQIKEQIDIWVTNGFPTVINKIISKSDNLFDSEFYPLTDLESENLVANSDLLIPKASPNENQALGFYYENATDITLSNGIAKFTPTAPFGSMGLTLTGLTGNKLYVYTRFKTTSTTSYMSVGEAGSAVSHSGSGNFEFLSTITTITASPRYPNISFGNSTTYVPIEVDYIGVINITDLVSRGILPSGLTDAQYKAILDSACNRSKTPMVNVPLRETSLISVEPSTAYKFIKASENTPIHKVVEYATDGQVVKVTTLSYTDHKATFTTQSQTTKIKLVSDLMNRSAQMVTNNTFNNTTGWVGSGATLSVDNKHLRVSSTGAYAHFQTFYNFNYISGNTYYSKLFVNAVGKNIDTLSLRYIYNNGSDASPNIDYKTPAVAGTLYKFSGVFMASTSANACGINILATTSDTTESTGSIFDIYSAVVYDITSFKNAGVVNDTGTLFSRLTNDEIKDQMDIWVQNGFPDHVIHALYPNGVDSAIAIKYNDADDIFRPQQIDELPLGITLRSGEYWENGYIVKQNGNAEYYPLSNTFSAWNYGQLEAIYDSGIPADFTIKFAQNTKAQVQTNSEYLVEARERLDTLRINQELLIEKLGVNVEADDYDSYVGITSAEYEYFGLEGIEEGDELNIDAYGQGVLNLLPNTITASQTAFGLTITYDDTTGIVTVNGTSTSAGNIILKTGMVLGKPQGTTVQLMRYFVDGTANLNGSYIGYLLAGTSVSNRINENSESLYDPYINASGDLKASGALSGVAGTSGQSLIFQVFASGMVFTDFKFKLGVFEGLTLQPFVMPGVSNSTAVDVYNHTANKLNTAYTTTPSAVSGITVTYDHLSQEYIFDGTASGANSIILSTNLFSVKSGDRLSIKRLYQSGDITPVSALPTISLISGATTIVSNSIYKMTAPEGQTPTPDVTFNTGTASADLTNVTLKLSFASGDVFNSYRCRIMIHDKSSDIGYAPYNSTKIGSISLEARARGELSFTAIDFGILSFVPQTDKLNVVFGTSLTDLTKTNLEYNAGIQSPNRRISELNERLSNVDNPFRDKVIAIWGDSRESNNPTSDPYGVGDQKDTSYPALLAKKLGATVLNFGLSGGAWAENTFQQDAESAIVNRVLTQDVDASADVIIISSMNDFKLATPLGSPDTSNKTASTFYGAMRLTYDRLATKYPAKKIWLVLPQKRFDEATNYGGGDYLSYRKAQIEVAREYGILTIDLYNNFPNTKPTFYATYMLNDTHFSALGNDYVAELITRSLIGNGNSGIVNVIPPMPQINGTYTLKVVVLNGVHTFSWVLDS